MMMKKAVEDSNAATAPMSIDSTGQANSPHTPHAPTAGQNGATVATQTTALPNESSSSTSPRNTTSTLDQSKASNIGTANSTKEPNNTTTTSDNNNPPSITNTRSRRDRPCDACRRRKSRCVLNEGTTVCVLCRFHNQDCTFLQSPQPRKRRLAAGATGDNKRDRERERERDKEGRHRGKDVDIGDRNRERGINSKKRFDNIFYSSASLPTALLFPPLIIFYPSIILDVSKNVCRVLVVIQR